MGPWDPLSIIGRLAGENLMALTCQISTGILSNQTAGNAGVSSDFSIWWQQISGFETDFESWWMQRWRLNFWGSSSSSSPEYIWPVLLNEESPYWSPDPKASCPFPFLGFSGHMCRNRHLQVTLPSASWCGESCPRHGLFQQHVSWR